MPGQHRSGEQRIATTAAIAAARGATNDEIVAKLLKQYNFLTKDEATSYATQGQLGKIMGDQLSEKLVTPGEGVGGGFLGAAYDEKEATIYVVIDDPDGATTVRQIRLPLSASTTIEDVNAIVEEVSNGWRSQSGKQGEVISWSVGFVL
jgi:hypothetical protein